MNSSSTRFWTVLLLLASPAWFSLAQETHRSTQLAEFVFVRTDWTNVYNGVGAVAGGDIDSDGDVDIVGLGGGSLVVIENTGSDPTQWTIHGNLDSTRDAGVNGSDLFDVDGDGDLDVVGARYNNDLGWWENPGGQLHSSAWSFHPFESGVDDWFLHDLIRADLDRDGIAREFVAVLQYGYWDAPFHIYWYTPSANPTDAWTRNIVTQNQAGPNNNHAGIDAGDIDGDGDIDLSFSNGWFESSGSPAGTWTWHKLIDTYGISNSLVRDIDDDGDSDLVVSAGHHGQGLFWIENTGTERDVDSWVTHELSVSEGNLNARHRFGSADNHPQHLHHPEGLQVEDLDGDGDLDVLVSELFFGEDAGEPKWDEQQHNLYIYENAGGSIPAWIRHNISPDSWPSHLPHLVDFDGDGRQDIITQGPHINNISYLNNRSIFQPESQELNFDLRVIDNNYPSNGVGWSAAGDVSGDGLPDVVAGGGGTIVWYRAPDWTRSVVDNQSNAGGNGGLVTDVDLDGDLDIISAEYKSESRVVGESWYGCRDFALAKSRD